MHDVTYELKQLAARHKEGSYATQADRKIMLMAMGEQLVAAGYKHLHVDELKGRHVNRLLALWEEQQLSPSTIKNRLSTLRWWARHIDNPGLMKKDNAAYGIAKRETIARTSKAKELPVDHLVQVKDAHVRMSLQLQRVFGLRREESIKLRPWQADKGGRLVLQDSWTKGGRGRDVPIRTLAQRDILDKAKALVRLKSASLIPADKTYVEQLRRYESLTARAGLHKLHGLRHAYAHDRFLELTGFACPVAGGPGHADLTPTQREADYDARVLISDELGHSREAITAAYLGR